MQSVFSSLEDVKTPMNGGTLVISGDGRYFNRDAVQIIAKVRRLCLVQGNVLAGLTCVV
jgi:phosphoglucomutase